MQIFLTLVAWRLQRDLRGFHLAFSVITLLLLALAFSLFSVGEHRQRMAEFEFSVKAEEARLARASTYVELLPAILIRPSPGSMLLSSNSDKLVNAALLPGVFGSPVFWNSSRMTNPLIASSLSSGFCSVSVAILILLSMVLAHSTLCGEISTSSLKLVLTNGVSRSSYFCAEWVAITLHTFLLFVAAFGVFAVVVTVGEVGLPVFNAQFGLFLLVTLLTLTASVSLGMLISGISRRPSSALLTSILVWVGFVWIWPVLADESSRLAVSIQGKPANPARLTDPLDARFVANLPRTAHSGQYSSVSIKSLTQITSRYRSRSIDLDGFQTVQFEDRVANLLRRFSIMSAYQKAVEDIFGIGGSAVEGLVLRGRTENTQLKTMQYMVLQRNPERAFIVTDLDPPLPEDRKAFLIKLNPSDLTRTRLASDIVILLMWVIFCFSAAFVAFQARPIRSE